MAPRSTYAYMLAAVLATYASLNVAASDCTSSQSTCDWSSAGSNCANGAFCGLSDCSTPCVTDCSNNDCAACADAIGGCGYVSIPGSSSGSSTTDYTLKYFQQCEGLSDSTHVCVPFDDTTSFLCGKCPSGSTSTTITLPSAGPCVTQSTCDWSDAGRNCTNGLFCGNSDCTTPCFKDDCDEDCSTCLASFSACFGIGTTTGLTREFFGDCTGSGCIDFALDTVSLTCGKCTSSSNTTIIITSASPKRSGVEDTIVVYLVLAAGCLLSLCGW